MANYGVTDTGFVLKRLDDLLREKRQRAVQLFQDLVQEGDVVDTSESSLLGRLIALDVVGDANLWEAAQLVYSAFDPNSATGIALDNLVAIGGLTRQGETFTTVSLLLSGDTNTSIPLRSEVSSSSTNNRFTTSQLVQLNTTSASGITVNVNTVQNNTLYQITYSTSTSTQNVQYTSDADATEAEILAGLQAAITSGHPTLTASVVGTTLVVDRNDIFQTVNFSVTANMGVSKVRKTVDAICTVSGPIEQLSNTIQTITTPVLGWDSVTNPFEAAVGRLEETDEELRIRFRNSKFERATNIIESLYSALLGVEGVSKVIIYENDTDVTDSNGVPPHSFLPIIVGGLSPDIGNAIWQNKPIGILSYGNTTVSITDRQGFNHDISFERPNPVVIYIEMTLTTDAKFPADGEAQIKSAIVDYFQNNYGIGDDVIYSRLFTPINSVPGHQVDSLFIGLTASPVGTSNISVAFNAIANINDTNIVVNV